MSMLTYTLATGHVNVIMCIEYH